MILCVSHIHFTHAIYTKSCPFQGVFSYIKAKQRSPYVLNTSGDSTEDQDGDSRYFSKTGFIIPFVSSFCTGVVFSVHSAFFCMQLSLVAC